MSGKQAGFSLIELLFGIVVAAVLATVSFLGYQEYVKNARLREAQAVLMEQARFMERFYHQNRSFKKNSTEWPTLPIDGTGVFCIRPHGVARGALPDRFTLKAVAYDKNGEPRILKINESLTTIICESSGSVCEEGKTYFSGSDKKCTVYRS